MLSDQVRVDGSGETDIITLAGKSEMRYNSGSRIIFDAATLEAEGRFKVQTKGGHGKRTFKSDQVLAFPRKKEEFPRIDSVVSEPSLEVIVSGRQERSLVVDNPGDYYLMPLGVIKRVLRETIVIEGQDQQVQIQPNPGIKGHLKDLADRENLRRSRYSPILGITTLAIYNGFRIDFFHDSEMARHIFPFWDSNNDFVLLKSVGVENGFTTLKEATLKLEGRVSMNLPDGFISDGVEYKSGRISGKGRVTLRGGVDKLALASPLSVESDFARITGQLDLIRSDGIAKNWGTSAQLSPASLRLSAKSDSKSNPKYWTGVAGLGLTGLLFGTGPAFVAFEWVTHSATYLQSLGSVYGMVSSVYALFISNTLRVNQEKTLIQEAHIQSSYTGNLYTGNIRNNPRLS